MKKKFYDDVFERKCAGFNITSEWTLRVQNYYFAILHSI